MYIYIYTYTHTYIYIHVYVYISIHPMASPWYPNDLPQGHHLPDHDRTTFLLKRSLEKMQKPCLLSNSVLKDVQRSLWKMDIDG